MYISGENSDVSHFVENLDAYLPFFTSRLDAQSPQSLKKDLIKDHKKKGTR